MPAQGGKPKGPKRTKTMPDVTASQPPPPPLRRATTVGVTPQEASAAPAAPPPETRNRRRSSLMLLQSAMDSEEVEELERALRLGLDAGLPDEALLPGIERLVLLDAKRKDEEAAAAAAAQAAADAAIAEERAAEEHRRANQQVPRDGALVKIRGLTTGVGALGGAPIRLEQQNGRIGRVVEDPSPTMRYLSISAVAWDEMPANPTCRRLVTVHTGTTCSDADQRHGTWLALPLQHVEPQ